MNFLYLRQITTFERIVITNHGSGSFSGCKDQAKAIPDKASDAEFKKATSLFYDQQKDSAFYYFNQFVNRSNDTARVAIAYWYIAAIQANFGDYYGSQESLLKSMQALDAQDSNTHYIISSDYSELGNTSLALKNFDDAIRYYNEAIKFGTDSLKDLIFENSIGVVYMTEKKYDKAIETYQSILNKRKEFDTEYARVLSNLAKTKWLKDSAYYAAPEMKKALLIRRNSKDNLGLNASYSHLADFYTKLNPDSARLYADSMYQQAKENKNPDDQLEALQKIIKLSDHPSIIKPYLFRFFDLSDSVQKARFTAKNQFALIRFESDKAKSENLLLLKDNSEKKVQIIKQRIFVFGAIFLLVFGTITGFIWYKRRKQRLMLESQTAIRESQLKTSQKVHDVVANGLYRIMSGLEHEEPVQKTKLLDNIETLYEQSRDISYDESKNIRKDYAEMISELLTSFAGNKTRVVVAGNNNEIWEHINPNAKPDLLNILQELMVNMKKHSKAQNVAIKFEKADAAIAIFYKDDGVGFTESSKKGNGLINTENRIRGFDGKIKFETGSNGLNIQITIPII